MPEEHDSLIRNLTGQGQGDSTFVDLSKLHPINETSAAMSGAGKGAIPGALLAVGYEFYKQHPQGCLDIATDIATDGMLDAPKANAAPANRIITATLLVVPMVVGAVKSVLGARTHNNWAREMQSRLDKKQAAEQSDGHSR